MQKKCNVVAYVKYTFRPFSTPVTMELSLAHDVLTLNNRQDVQLFNFDLLSVFIATFSITLAAITTRHLLG